MGYTHYFTQKQDVPMDQWATLKTQLSEVFQKLPAHSDSSGGGYAASPLVICDGDGTKLIKTAKDLFKGYEAAAVGNCICFNGDERQGHDLGHETFYLSREGQGFNFCKTARKPYDWLVMACILLAHKHCPNCWAFASDGNAADWQPVMAWMEANGFGAQELPFTPDN